MAEDSRREDAPPSARLVEIALGYRAAQALYVFTELDIADALADGAQTAAYLAAVAEADTSSLVRLLRVAERMGIVAETGEGKFRLTPLGEPLRKGVEGSARDLIRLFGHPIFYEPWGQLRYSVRTGQPAFDHLRGMNLYTYLEEHPDVAAIFNAGMAATTGVQAVIAAYDFADAKLVVDVGGGTGALMIGILQAYSSLQGILFDLPGTAHEAREHIEREGLAQRCQIAGGDFFSSVPAGGDLYTLFDVVHNWNDEKATAILTIVRGAMKTNSKLLLIERVPSEDADPLAAAFSDLNGLVLLGGRERIADEHRAILAAAGFRLNRILPTPTPWSIVEAVPIHNADS